MLSILDKAKICRLLNGQGMKFEFGVSLERNAGA